MRNQHSMLICASRRTDIPAFHSGWFMNRIRDGYVLVRNPVAKDIVYEISLRERDVDGMVFVTKDPRPMESHLDELSSMGFEIMFQVTMNPYGVDIEPNVPEIGQITDSFIRISDRIGKDRMLWRYDPVIFSDIYGEEFHRERLEHMCSTLEGHVGRCTFSFLTRYDKLSGPYDSGALRDVTDNEKERFMEILSRTTSAYGMEASSCCLPGEHHYGIKERGCIDSGMLAALGIPFERQTSSYREGCTCAKCIDIGAYDTCGHGCIYCYANGKDPVKRSARTYDQDSAMLFGGLRDGDRIIRIGGRRAQRITDF